jgi:hypothetical protein
MTLLLFVELPLPPRRQRPCFRRRGVTHRADPGDPPGVVVSRSTFALFGHVALELLGSLRASETRSCSVRRRLRCRRRWRRGRCPTH